jgi:hypothetical protein
MSSAWRGVSDDARVRELGQRLSLTQEALNEHRITRELAVQHLSATARPSFFCRARYTAPIPPTPSRTSSSSSGKSGASSSGFGGGVPGRGAPVAMGSTPASTRRFAASSIRHRRQAASGAGSVTPHF